MNKKKISRLLVFWIMLCISVFAISQPPRGPFVAPFTGTEEYQKNFTNWSPDADKINNQLKLFTISVGTEDFLYESVKKNIVMFEEKKIKVKPFIVSGGHTWMNCKLFLATTLQEIFK